MKPVVTWCEGLLRISAGIGWLSVAVEDETIGRVRGAGNLSLLATKIRASRPSAGKSLTIAPGVYLVYVSHVANIEWRDNFYPLSDVILEDLCYWCGTRREILCNGGPGHVVLTLPPQPPLALRLQPAELSRLAALGEKLAGRSRGGATAGTDRATTWQLDCSHEPSTLVINARPDGQYGLAAHEGSTLRVISRARLAQLAIEADSLGKQRKEQEAAP